MASFNKVILMGRLTAAPELKQTPNGVSICRFSIAVDRRWAKEGDEKKADFFNIVAWRQTAEFVCKYFTKGSAILIDGALQTDSWTDQNGQKHYTTDIVASEVSFCESKKNSENASPSNNQNGSQGKIEPYADVTPLYHNTASSFEAVADDGNLPF